MLQLGERHDAVIEQARNSGISLKEFTESTRKKWIIQELEKNNFNQWVTARVLGVNRNTLALWIAKLKIPLGQLKFDWHESRKPVRSASQVIAREQKQA